MKINTSDRHVQGDRATATVVNFLRRYEGELGLEQSHVYYEFPLYKDIEGGVVSSKLLLVSPNHGVVAFGTSEVSRIQNLESEFERVGQDLTQAFTSLYSRLLRNGNLKESIKSLSFPTYAVIFMPFIENGPNINNTEIEVIFTENRLFDFLYDNLLSNPISEETFQELISTVEGAKGLIRPRPRDVEDMPPNSKGVLVNRLEAEIASFDQRQITVSTTPVNGVERIRGLAGSGKTVVLALKAAITHLREPDKLIVYTFHTKSLYQYIRRMITRFYRQFDDSDPDWSRLLILHAWGGVREEGVYYNACLEHSVIPLTFKDASRKSPDAFGYACNQLLSSNRIRPMYDYIFVDEGQDFPNSFLKLCVQLSYGPKMVCAYDELQTIFQTKAISPREFLPPDMVLSDDTNLYKCYRNPREILVCAHALGFGLYGPRIAQMLENKAHWEDVGYRVVAGDFTEGSETVIERPKENSLTSISDLQSPFDIVEGLSYGSFEEEVNAVSNSIKTDLEAGLRPEDILVIVVDDRNARGYLDTIVHLLGESGIPSNNVHSDNLNVRDFQREGAVTLSTVHKAKGNEAYMVYVIGVDALFSTYAGVRERNMLFTAMTRAKGWVRVSGIGHIGSPWRTEILTALRNFPFLKFAYPSEAELKVMKRDLAESAIRKQNAERQLDEIMNELSAEEIQNFMTQRKIKKGKS